MSSPIEAFRVWAWNNRVLVVVMLMTTTAATALGGHMIYGAALGRLLARFTAPKTVIEPAGGYTLYYLHLQ
jgi:hypothetical protein